MAITGLILIGFLLMHMWGNLKAFIGADAYNHYAEWLKGETEDGGLLYPLIPKGWFIWIFRAFMLASIVAHMWSAWVLTVRAHGSRNTKYISKKAVQASFASKTMRWGGVILATLLVFHLAQFTVHAVHIGFQPGATPFQMITGDFKLWYMVLLYAVFVAVVCTHVWHGFWSAFATLGANTSARSRAVLNACASIVAVLLFVGFMAMPIAIFVGVIK